MAVVIEGWKVNGNDDEEQRDSRTIEEVDVVATLAIMMVERSAESASRRGEVDDDDEELDEELDDDADDRGSLSGWRSRRRE